jgi:DNA-binding NarL/FixJ family response regulator
MTSDKKKKNSVLLVEDHPIVRFGLSVLISQHNDLNVVSAIENGEKALEFLKKTPVDIIIVDLSLPDMSGIDLIKFIRRMDVQTPILVLSVLEEEFYAERAFAAGALGYVMKQEVSETIIEAIRKVISNEIYASDKIKNRLLKKAIGKHEEKNDAYLSTLTDRELQVFELLGKGFETRQIADNLRLSIKTIETYREHIKVKLSIKNSTELIKQASQWELTRRK